jgi:periplasmic protein CpxP/Spy
MKKERTLGAWRAGRRLGTAAGVLGAFLGFFLVCGTASAYQYAGGQKQGSGKRSPEERMNRRMDMMSKKLNLTDDQKAKMKPLLENEVKQMQDLRQDTSLSRQEKRAKFQQMRESTNSQIRSLLNPDQQKKFDEMQQQMKERRGRWHKGGGGADAPPANDSY